MAGLSAESSCPGSAPQAGGVRTWPCVSDPVRKAAAGAAAEPPSGAGEVFGRRSVPHLGMAGRGKELCCHFRKPETSCGVEGRHLAAYRGGRHEGRT